MGIIWREYSEYECIFCTCTYACRCSINIFTCPHIYNKVLLPYLTHYVSSVLAKRISFSKKRFKHLGNIKHWFFSFCRKCVCMTHAIKDHWVALQRTCTLSGNVIRDPCQDIPFVSACLDFDVNTENRICKRMKQVTLYLCVYMLLIFRYIVFV